MSSAIDEMSAAWDVIFCEYTTNSYIILGRLSLPYMGGYCTSKFAVEAFTDALRVEVCHWDMKIILIEPGFFKTSMTAKTALGSQLDEKWSKLSPEMTLEYGEEFFTKSNFTCCTCVQRNVCTQH